MFFYSENDILIYFGKTQHSLEGVTFCSYFLRIQIFAGNRIFDDTNLWGIFIMSVLLKCANNSREAPSVASY